MSSSVAWSDELTTIQGREIVLRQLVDQDAPAMLSIFGDPEVMRFWSSPPLNNLVAAAKLISEIRTAFNERRLFQWGFSSREGGEVLGTCTLFNLDLAHRRAEVGFALRRDLWGRGLASDALGSLIAFSFERLDLHRLEADVDPGN
ncbi:MAG: GNAT family N-acetyltransferase, partial [Gemmatimonadota bacterium]|nr:GNAT family N-acetyltransferase [Gemmatimonadota bacterium]